MCASSLHPTLAESASEIRMIAAAAGGDLLNVGYGLFEQIVLGGDHYDRHVLVDECDGTVLQLAGGITLGVDVGDLLKLKRPSSATG